MPNAWHAAVLLAGLGPLAAASAAGLTASAGALAVAGTLGQGGSFSVQAVLKDGNFTGTMKVAVDGIAVEGPLMERRSYLENGRCVFRVEQGRARAELAGKCDSTAFDARFDVFSPGGGGGTGKAQGTVTLRGGAAGGVPAAGTLPAGKLTCAYQDRRIGVRPGEATQYSLHFSNMPTLTLAEGRYSAGKSGGAFERQGRDKIRLVSGPWSGAVGSLEPDRSGRPAVVFHIEENRRPDGVHLVDPYTTRCTESRS